LVPTIAVAFAATVVKKGNDNYHQHAMTA